MPKLFLPGWVKKHILINEKGSHNYHKYLASKLNRFNCSNPEVSVVIPAWNEEKNILATLSSFANQSTNRNVELIVINNNSSDDTQNILDSCGVKSFFEPNQSISFARQRGLMEANGKYILCADSDSIYPSTWIDTMVDELERENIACVYGKHSFIPQDKMNRLFLIFYELTANSIFVLRKKRREYLNVLGFNFAFRRSDGLLVGGFNIYRNKWSDGWMGMKLAEIGKLKRVTNNSALVWTNPRRLIVDGGLIKAFFKRINKELRVLKEYLVLE